MASDPTRATPELLYRLLADNATDVVTLHDAVGRYMYVSPSITGLTGYAPDELRRRRPAATLVHPDDVPGVREQIAPRCSGDGIATFEYRLRRADGDSTMGRDDRPPRRRRDPVLLARRHRAARRLRAARPPPGAAVRRRPPRRDRLQRPDLDALFERTVAAVAETLGVGVVTVTEHVDAGTAHVRAGSGPLSMRCSPSTCRSAAAPRRSGRSGRQPRRARVRRPRPRLPAGRRPRPRRRDRAAARRGAPMRHDALHDAPHRPAEPHAAARPPASRAGAGRARRGAASRCSSWTSTT